MVDFYKGRLMVTVQWEWKMELASKIGGFLLCASLRWQDVNGSVPLGYLLLQGLYPGQGVECFIWISTDTKFRDKLSCNLHQQGLLLLENSISSHGVKLLQYFSSVQNCVRTFGSNSQQLLGKVLDFRLNLISIQSPRSGIKLTCFTQSL